MHSSLGTSISAGKLFLLKSRRVNLRLLGASAVTRIEWIQLACTAEKVEVMREHVRARRSKYQSMVHELLGGRGPGGRTFVLLTPSTTRISRDLHTSLTHYDLHIYGAGNHSFGRVYKVFGVFRLWILQEICASCCWIFACYRLFYTQVVHSVIMQVLKDACSAWKIGGPALIQTDGIHRTIFAVILISVVK